MRFSGLDQFLPVVVRDKLALTNMGFLASSSPDLVSKRTTLALGVLVRTARVETRVEFARCWKVGELAALRGAVGSVATQRHGRVFERAVWVGTVGEELAQGFSLVGHLDGRRRMACSALAVLACCSVRAVVGRVNGCALGSSGGLVSKGTVLARAPKVKATGAVGVVLVVVCVSGLLVGVHVHVVVASATVAALLLLLLLVIELSTAALGFDTIEQGTTLLLGTILLESWVDCRRHESGHNLGHHPGLFLQQRHEMHLVIRVHLHHIPGHRVAVHAHPTHVSSTVHPPPVALHIPAMRIYPASARLTTNPMQRRVCCAIHRSVNVAKHPTTSAIAIIAHCLGARWTIRSIY